MATVRSLPLTCFSHFVFPLAFLIFLVYFGVMPDLSTALKKCCTPMMTQLIRGILYDKRLTYGARILALIVLDSPATSQPTTAVLSRKMGSSESQVSKWRSELRRHEYRVRPVKSPPPPDSSSSTTV